MNSTDSNSLNELPEGFVYVTDIVPNIEYELRYCTDNNFIGRPIDGYLDSVLIISAAAAYKLYEVQKELNKKGLGLKIYDAYRPQTAVNHFVRWAKDQADTLMKQQYYPEVDKSQLFDLGYISSKSGHTRGSTVDLTIINMNTKEELDMGAPYDFFGTISHHAYEDISDLQKKNRRFIKEVMSRHNFRSYKYEWWHYTLRQEPFPKTYFDFAVE